MGESSWRLFALEEHRRNVTKGGANVSARCTKQCQPYGIAVLTCSTAVSISRIGRDMARKVRVELVSDLSQVEADETVTFALDGVTYEIDLTTQEASSLRDALASYVKAGRRIGGRRGSTGGSRGRSSANRGIDLAEARAWIKENVKDIKISDRGRLPAKALDAYKAAHGLS
ncbi:Lsr2 family protein [Cellulomonas sp. APG4]|uniref:histone-like nucleoid-structuring protein Lsr2 n=1 Tax=Cellulomonas sp. APG4 TaxID=1538656 RepID=UPI00351B78C9